jgi:hypothetical protein
MHGARARAEAETVKGWKISSILHFSFPFLLTGLDKNTIHPKKPDGPPPLSAFLKWAKQMF